MAGAVDDTARLERILRRYPNDGDIAWLAERIEPRHTRIARRDAAIRAATVRSPGPLTVAAKALAHALSAYQRTGWLVEQYLPVVPGAEARHVALHQILRLNCGKPLGWQTIYNVFKE